MADLPGGPIFTKLQDPRATREIVELWTRINNLRVTKDIVDARSTAEALGPAFKDGQLEVLNRLLAGATGQGIKLSRDKDDYTAYFIKQGRAGDAFEVLYVSGDMTGAYTARIAAGDGGCLMLEKTGGGTDPLLRLNETGSFTGNLIETSLNNARLTNAGVWTDATCWKRLKHTKPAKRAGFLEKLKKLRIFHWRPKKNPKEKHFGPVLDDLKRHLGMEDPSISDIAGLALFGVQCLLTRVEALEKEIEKCRSVRQPPRR
jgi:hypothetical protein